MRLRLAVFASFVQAAGSKGGAGPCIIEWGARPLPGPLPRQRRNEECTVPYVDWSGLGPQGTFDFLTLWHAVVITRPMVLLLRVVLRTSRAAVPGRKEGGLACGSGEH